MLECLCNGSWHRHTEACSGSTRTVTLAQIDIAHVEGIRWIRTTDTAISHYLTHYIEGLEDIAVLFGVFRLTEADI